MKTSEVLKAARKHLPTHRSMGICYAIINSQAGRVIDRTRVMDMVRKRIHPFGYASHWLAWQVLRGGRKWVNSKDYAQGWTDIYDWLDLQDTPDIQMWRHEWLNKMIAEFKKKGD